MDEIDEATDGAGPDDHRADRAPADGAPGARGWFGRVVHSPAMPWIVVTLAVVVVVVGVGLWSQLHPLLDTVEVDPVSFKVPTAPQLVAGDGETVFRIDPTRSTASYAVDENIVGQTASRATGSTSGIAGDLAIDGATPADSRLGPIVVDVQQLHSDNNLRDARIRHEFLESDANPLVQFRADSLSGLPSSIVDGQAYDFTVAGPLTVRGSDHPVTWQATATKTGDELAVTATTVVRMSDLGIGPISLVGLVSTADDVTLDLDLVAVDAATATVADEIAAPGTSVATGTSPSFRDEVEPILAANCAACHASGELGAEHWTLDTAADAHAVADGIGTVTVARYMPPWPASTVGVPLDHSKALSQDDIDTIVAWSKAGGPLDVPDTTPITPTPSTSTVQPRHDVDLQMPEGYDGSTANPNDYRCFALDPGFAAPTFVTGYEVTPDVRAEIHHVQIFHIDTAQATEAAAKDGADGKPGWPCYGGHGLGGAKGSAGRLKDPTDGGGLIAGWVPGQDPVIFPGSSGVLFQPGDQIVFQVHYHYATDPVPDRSTVSLQTDPGTAPIAPIVIVNPLAPVEIPCLPGETAPLCDRSASLAHNAELYGRSFTEPGLLLICKQDPAAMTEGFTGVATSSCDSTVTRSGVIVSAMGHMHTLGKTFRLTLHPDQPDEQVILDIPMWNFDWQMNYSLQTPLRVEKGDTIRMSCSWDRAIDPTRPPRYIVFAEGTEDEMCFSTYALIPDGDG